MSLLCPPTHSLRGKARTRRTPNNRTGQRHGVSLVSLAVLCIMWVGRRSWVVGVMTALLHRSVWYLYPYSMEDTSRMGQYPSLYCDGYPNPMSGDDGGAFG